MSNVRSLHSEAMQLAQKAFMARQNEEFERAAEFARQASKLEALAAQQIPFAPSSEPTRSILFRSAASLALQAKDLQFAQWLVFQGLAGSPPDKTKNELLDLYEQINFHSHLEVKGEVLQDEDFQLSLDGNAVAPGMIISEEFIRRVTTTKSLIDRTVQRKMGRDYQKTGAPASIYRPFNLYLSTGRQNSFAITIRLSKVENTNLPLLFSTDDIIDEIVQGINLVNSANEEELLKLITNNEPRHKAYYYHFINSVKDIAPDGDRITLVGFTTKKEMVALTRTRDSMQFTAQTKKDGDLIPITAEGLLDFASSRKKRDIMGLTTEDNTEYNIKVETGMEDIVKGYFKQRIVVAGLYDKTHNLIIPSDIRPI